jgi:uncharacterized protein
MGRETTHVFMSPDLSEVTVPLWVVVAATHSAHFHQVGSSNAYLTTPTAHKRLDSWDDWFQKAYAAEVVADHKAFFDHWLKGIDTALMATPPVRLEIRSGNGAAAVIHEHEWPIARTRYQRWYLESAGRLSDTRPSAEAEVSYSAEGTGTSFVSEPLAEEMTLAGYGKVGLRVSSTSHDMDIFVSVRVIGEDGDEVDFTGFATSGYAEYPIPLTMGWLKASHRRIDEQRSTEYTVKHTHLKADYAPLEPGHPVDVEIELIPHTGLLRRGQRIRVDVQPRDGVAHGTHHAYDPSYHDGATNTLHVGPVRLGYVQLPLI